TSRRRDPSFSRDWSSDVCSSDLWYVSDGWANGDHQNCTWSKDMVSISDGVLKLGIAKRQTKDREYVCGEIQTHKRFSYGTFEAQIGRATWRGRVERSEVVDVI